MGTFSVWGGFMSRQTGAALPLCATRRTSSCWHQKPTSRRQADRASPTAPKEKCIPWSYTSISTRVMWGKNAASSQAVEPQRKRAHSVRNMHCLNEVASCCTCMHNMIAGVYNGSISHVQSPSAAACRHNLHTVPRMELARLNCSPHMTAL